MTDERMDGRVKWFDGKKGFGFIVVPIEMDSNDVDGQDYFVHYTEVEKDTEGYKVLKRGQKVSFVPVHAAGGPRAQDVRIIN